MPSSSSLDIGHGRPGQGKGRLSHPRVPSASLYDAFDAEQIKQFKEAFTVSILDDTCVLTVMMAELR